MNTLKSQISGSVFDDAVATPKNAVGAVAEFADGRKFVYCSTATVFAAGEGISSAAASAVTANSITAVAAGEKSVTVVLADVTANLYAGGYLFITDDAGQGYTYKIKSNTATAATYVTFTLYEGLKVALTAASDFVVAPERHTLVIQWGTATDPVGVAVVPTTGASSSNVLYFWVQFYGPGVVLVTTATSIARGAALAAGATGGVVIATAGASYVGNSLSEAENAAGFQPAYLMLPG